mmetsp:Transcript_64369/g.119662  ORF Transcript_64369/g.119662 Transcript_64369/m.119662 type:complete len:295 (-) Transcript_64369:59-943(-)
MGSPSYIALLFIALPCIAAGQVVADNPNYVHEDFHVVEEERTPAVELLEEAIASFVPNSTVGIVMFAHPNDNPWSMYSIPVWRGYARRHGYDFFLWQEALLDGGCRTEWSEPLLLRLLYARVEKWQTIMLVRSNSVPVGFEKTVKWLVKKYVTKQRWKSDPVAERGIWCPLDCKTKDSKDSDCKAIFLTGCIFLRKPLVAGRIWKWWDYRKVERGDRDCSTPDSLADGLVQARQNYFQQFLFSNAFADIHVDAAKYIAMFYNKGRELQNQMADLAQKHSDFRAALHDAEKRGEL